MASLTAVVTTNYSIRFSNTITEGRNSSAVHTQTYPPNTDAKAAIKANSGFKVLLNGLESAKGNYYVWDTDSKGIIYGLDGKTAEQAAKSGWEQLFGIDLNNDGLANGTGAYKIFHNSSAITITKDVTRAVVHTLTHSLDTGMQKQQLKPTLDSKSCLMGSNQQKAIITSGIQIPKVLSLRALDGKQLNKQLKVAGNNSLALTLIMMGLLMAPEHIKYFTTVQQSQ